MTVLISTSSSWSSRRTKSVSIGGLGQSGRSAITGLPSRSAGLDGENGPEKRDSSAETPVKKDKSWYKQQAKREREKQKEAAQRRAESVVAEEALRAQVPIPSTQSKVEFPDLSKLKGATTAVPDGAAKKSNSTKAKAGKAK